MSKKKFEFKPVTLKFIESYWAGSQEQMNCRHITHPGFTCWQFHGLKAKQYFKQVVYMQVIVTLLPALVSKYKELNRKNIKAIIKKFIIASFWLVMCYIVPNISACMVSKYTRWPLKPNSLLPYTVSFAMGATFCVIDSKSRIR